MRSRVTPTAFPIPTLLSLLLRGGGATVRIHSSRSRSTGCVGKRQRCRRHGSSGTRSTLSLSHPGRHDSDVSLSTTGLPRQCSSQRQDRGRPRTPDRCLRCFARPLYPRPQAGADRCVPATQSRRARNAGPIAGAPTSRRAVARLLTVGRRRVLGGTATRVRTPPVVAVRCLPQLASTPASPPAPQAGARRLRQRRHQASAPLTASSGSESPTATASTRVAVPPSTPMCSG